MKLIREMEISSLVLGGSAILLQKCYRGHVGRVRARKKKEGVKSIVCQRVYRGHLGRQAASREREKLEEIKLRHTSATKIQATWKMKVAREEYRRVRVHTLAATEIQRIYRGRIGRKTATRRKKWESTEPGPERLKLGLGLIEESKVAFERQQEEIDALHRAQQSAEARISHIHAELKVSWKGEERSDEWKVVSFRAMQYKVVVVVVAANHFYLLRSARRRTRNRSSECSRGSCRRLIRSRTTFRS